MFSVQCKALIVVCRFQFVVFSVCIWLIVSLRLLTLCSVNFLWEFCSMKCSLFNLEYVVYDVFTLLYCNAECVQCVYCAVQSRLMCLLNPLPRCIFRNVLENARKYFQESQLHLNNVEWQELYTQVRLFPLEL